MKLSTQVQTGALLTIWQIEFGPHGEGTQGFTSWYIISETETEFYRNIEVVIF